MSSIDCNSSRGSGCGPGKLIVGALLVGTGIITGLFATNVLDAGIHHHTPIQTESMSPNYSPTAASILTQPPIISSKPPSPFPTYQYLPPTQETGSPSFSPIASPSTNSPIAPTQSPTSASTQSSSGSPSLDPTSSGKVTQLAIENETPSVLKETSEWENGINCLDDTGVPNQCSAVLNPGDTQFWGAIQDSPSYVKAGIYYDVCVSLTSGNCEKYSGNIGITYSLEGNSMIATLTNNAGGTVELVPNLEGTIYKIQMVSIPTPMPVTAPPTSSSRPSFSPTSSAPTTQKPSAVPSIAAPSVSPFPTSPSYGETIEKSAWYIDWTVWFNGPPFSIPTGVNLINVFVGEFMYDSNGNPTLGGFGNLNLDQLDAFTTYCKEQNLPIDVKVSVGGSCAGDYCKTWNLLTSENTRDFAQGTVDFSHDNSLVGIDLDFEDEDAPQSQQILVGTFARQIKEIDPNLQISLCTNAGFGPNYPWQSIVKTILDAAVITKGKCPIDRLYIMSYYNALSDEEGWVNGWANWLLTTYNCPFSVTTVGIDTFDAHAYDPTEFADWALSKGYSIAHWAYDPAHPTNWDAKYSNLRGSQFKLSSLNLESKTAHSKTSTRFLRG